jgi:hypothetical protein
MSIPGLDGPWGGETIASDAAICRQLAGELDNSNTYQCHCYL